MICRNCGIEIADKAIVCFRCGTATTEARFKPAPAAMGRRSRPFALVALGLVVVLVLLTLAGLVPGCPMVNSSYRDHRTDASPRLDAARDCHDLLGAAA
jgi:hypothetical protein